MSVRIILNNAINNMSYGDNDSSINSIMYSLVRNINNSTIIQNRYKQNINSYFNQMFDGTTPTSLPSASAVDKSSVKNILMATTAYFLSDLNKYDFNMINSAFDLGLSASDVITLLFLNNYTDILSFCQINNIRSMETNNILTFKKLSAMYKLHYNY
jgi:hypothetical protein